MQCCRHVICQCELVVVRNSRGLVARGVVESTFRDARPIGHVGSRAGRGLHLQTIGSGGDSKDCGNALQDGQCPVLVHEASFEYCSDVTVLAPFMFAR
jgi:hypothetical protein